MWLQMAFLMEAALSDPTELLSARAGYQTAQIKACSPLQPGLGCAMPTSTSLASQIVQSSELKQRHLTEVSSSQASSSVPPLKYLPQRCLLPRTCRQITKLIRLGLPLHLMLSGQTRRFLREPQRLGLT